MPTALAELEATRVAISANYETMDATTPHGKPMLQSCGVRSWSASALQLRIHAKT
jgi:hypothetical protein